MEISLFVRALLSLLFVVGLMFGCLAFYKKFLMGKSLEKLVGKAKKKNRMQVLETLYLDRARRLVIVKKDDKEITLLLGNTDQIVSSK